MDLKNKKKERNNKERNNKLKSNEYFYMKFNQFFSFPDESYKIC